MSHFEDFDRRKAEIAEGRRRAREAVAAREERLQAISDDERRLRDALYALNRAIDPTDDTGREDVRRLVRIRDEVWDLGVELYGWTE